MALHPEDRYASARQLAGDLERWLADEPVLAHRETFSHRVARWSRRHWGWTQSVAVALLVVSCVSIASALLVNQARVQAEVQGRRADRNAQRERVARQQAEQFSKEKQSLVEREREQRRRAEELADLNAALAVEEKREAQKARRVTDFLVGTFEAPIPSGCGACRFTLPSRRGKHLRLARF